MLTAITRGVSPTIAAFLITLLLPEGSRAGRGGQQHRTYEACLLDLGVEVISLPAEAEYPDAVFVEDACVVLDEIAVMTRLGAPSRRGESQMLAPVLERYRPLRWMREPATLDGGDV